MDIVTLGAALSGAKKYTDDVVHGIAGGIKYKGEVNYYSNLPSNPTLSDAYTVKYSGTTGSDLDGTEYVWAENGGVAQWVDFSKDSYTKAETDALLNNKQNVLTVGTNLDDVPTEDSTNPITSGGVFDTVGNLDAALDSLIMSLEPKTITANGTYNPADDGVDGYNLVTVNVPNTYTAGDNGKVVNNQQLVSQTAYPTAITENDTYDTTLYNSVVVSVPKGTTIHSCHSDNISVLWDAENIKYYYDAQYKKLYIYGYCSASYNGSLNVPFESQLSDIGVPNTTATGYMYSVQGGTTTTTRLCGISNNTLSGTSTQFYMNALYNVTRHYIVGVFDFS